jgi:hypothetical protein
MVLLAGNCCNNQSHTKNTNALANPLCYLTYILQFLFAFVFSMSFEGGQKICNANLQPCKYRTLHALRTILVSSYLEGQKGGALLPGTWRLFSEAPEWAHNSRLLSGNNKTKHCIPALPTGLNAIYTLA